MARKGSYGIEYGKWSPDVHVVSEDVLLPIEEIIAAQPAVSRDARLLRQAKALEAARSHRIERDGVVYDSLAEMKRHDNLLRWQTAGIIEGLILKPLPIRILDGFDHPSIGHVRARNWQLDFVYQQLQEPFLCVWEDFKGRQLEAWKAALPFRLYALRDRHIFVNSSLSGWYTPAK